MQPFIQNTTVFALGNDSGGDNFTSDELPSGSFVTIMAVPEPATDGMASDEHGLNAMELEEPEEEQAGGAYSASSVRSVTSISRSITSPGDSCGKFVSTTSLA